MSQNKAFIACPSKSCSHNQQDYCGYPGFIQLEYKTTANEGEYLYCKNSKDTFPHHYAKETHEIHCPFIACKYNHLIGEETHMGTCSLVQVSLSYPKENVDMDFDDDIRGAVFDCKSFYFGTTGKERIS